MIGTKNGDGGRDGLIIVLSKVDPQADPNGTDHISGLLTSKAEPELDRSDRTSPSFYPYFSFF
jgi:hypothetical protein